LERAPGVHLLPARRGGLWGDSTADDGPTDPHLWLDPENAVAMTKAIVAALSKADPVGAARFAANGAKQMAALGAQERDLRAKLAGLRGRYLVFHDAYQYFEHRFDLKPLGAVTVAPDRPIGPRRLSMLRQANAVCVFREPQFPPHLIDALTEGSAMKVGVLDPLGADLPPGPGLYPKLLDNLARGLRDCLTRQ
jgi:zinc transport system substrate-binding protein